MFRLTTSLLFAGILTLAGLAPTAFGQSGPISSSAGSPPAFNQAGGGRVQFDNQTLPNMFQQMGYNVQTMNQANGTPYWIISMQQNGWNYRMEVKAYYVNGAIAGFWISSDLGQAVGNPAGLSSNGLLQLLEANNRIFPYFFAYNSTTGFLCLKLEYPYNGATQQQLQQMSNEYLAKVRETHPLWQNLRGGATNGLSSIVPSGK